MHQDGGGVVSCGADTDYNHDNKITSDELLEWSRRGNTIIEKMADIIDKEVYRIWLIGIRTI